MTEILLYLVKVALGQTVMFAFYRLFLARGTYFHINRFFLLSAIVLPLLFPLVRIGSVPGGEERMVSMIAQQIYLPVLQINIRSDGQIWIRLFTVLYLGGMLFMAMRLARVISSIVEVHSHTYPTHNGEHTLRISRVSLPPFSFFRNIYLDEGTYFSPESHSILLHEKVHVAQMHSLDLALAELNALLTWFNPVGRIIISALKETHEYLADAAVSEQTADKAGYCQLLYCQTVGVQQGLANYFNHSLTLKRITMMTKSKSGRYAGLKVLLAVPVVMLLIMALGSYNQAGALVSPADYLRQAQDPFNNLPDDTAKYTNPEKQPEYPGGQDALIKFLISNIRYPEAAREKGIQGTVHVQFTVDKQGKVQNISIKKGVDPLLDAEAIRVMGIMPDWNPGKVKGKPVNMVMVLPVAFVLDNKKK